jgi:hypothetical protein
MACAACEERARLLRAVKDAATKGDMAEAMNNLRTMLGPIWVEAPPKEPPPRP